MDGTLTFEKWSHNMTKPERPKALSIPAAASYLSISRASVYRLIKAGDLPLVKVVGRSLIHRSDADVLLLGTSAIDDNARANATADTGIFG